MEAHLIRSTGDKVVHQVEWEAVWLSSDSSVPLLESDKIRMDRLAAAHNFISHHNRNLCAYDSPVDGPSAAQIIVKR